MTSLKLWYFPTRGRAESVRLMLTDQGKQWEEVTVTGQTWGTLKKSCLFGQLPKLEDGDLTLFQTNAIRRYLARRLGVYGQNEKETALIDMMDESLTDLQAKYMKLIYQEYESGKDKYLQELPQNLARYENILSCNKGGFLVGSQISLADYILLLLLLNHQVLSPSCLDLFPILKSYLDRLCSRPNLKAYLQSDAFKNRPINANGKQ
ncbi:glutathione S-transferase P-like isoform X2 [Xyrauchen texanus]|uniref:glutathione S-transferase P-like isoform X2 n=1 Tax=Xyrauchen texanus TaxID=154827 RepID=UPI0022421A9E|nr:glutathione S-transferase P-like isoform X2 [Xyrauchen texanus]